MEKRGEVMSFELASAWRSANGCKRRQGTVGRSLQRRERNLDPGQACVGFELGSEEREREKKEGPAAWVRAQKGERLSSVNLQAPAAFLTYFSATRMV